MERGPYARITPVLKRVWSTTVALLMLGAIGACGGDQAAEVTITPDRVTTPSDRVVVDSGDFRTDYEREGDHEGTFLIFGGHLSDGESARFSVTLLGLPLEKARELYEKYPDFNKCDSPGASEAKAHTRRFDFVAADTDALNALRDALQEHEVNVESGGERVALRVRGEALELVSVIHRATGSDHRDEFHRVANFERQYVLAQSVQRVNTKENLEDG